MQFRKLALVGTGLIGASIGLRARELGAHVTGFDCDAAALQDALLRGAVDRTTDSAWPAEPVDALLIAIPVDATLALVRAFAEKPPLAGCVLDVASVKGAIAAAGRGLPNFVPTHPMAGSERSGPGAAYAGLFDEKAWMYDPHFAPGAVAAACELIATLGGRPIALDSQQHDRIVALTSHLPEIVSIALANCLASRLVEPDVAALCGPGMRGMLRLAASPWPMWAPIVTENAAPLAQEVRRLCAVLSDVAEALESGSPGELAPHFESAARALARLPPV